MNPHHIRGIEGLCPVVASAPGPAFFDNELFCKEL